MATYSVGLTGAIAGTEFTAQTIDIPDTAARQGGFQNAMATGTQVLCKLPDGSQKWFVIDDRSTLANPILRAV